MTSEKDDDDNDDDDDDDDVDYGDDTEDRPCSKQCDCQAVLAIAQHHPVDFCIYDLIIC